MGPGKVRYFAIAVAVDSGAETAAAPVALAERGVRIPPSPPQRASARACPRSRLPLSRVAEREPRFAWPTIRGDRQGDPPGSPYHGVNSISNVCRPPEYSNPKPLFNFLYLSGT